MTQKEIQRRVDDLLEQGKHDEIIAALDAISPPLPEPGTVVRWRKTRWDQGKWCSGIVNEMQSSVIAEDGFGHLLANIEWKPARVLADDEVAVEKNELANLRYFVNNPSAWDDGFSQNVSDAIERLITRAEAERMEAEG